MITVVAFIAFLLSGGSLLVFSILNGIRSAANRLGADALVVPVGYKQETEGALLKGEPSAFYFDGELVGRMADLQGVSDVSPQLFIATMDSAHCSFPVQLIGFDPESDFVIAPWLKDQISEKLQDDELVIGNNIEAKTGDVLRFFTVDYKVAARLEKTGMGFDTSIFINMATAKAILKQYAKYGHISVPNAENPVSVITVNLAKGYEPSDFARMIRMAFRTDGLDVILTKSIIGNISSSLNALLTIILTLALVFWILSIGILAILFAVTLNERKREFGVYRALGSSRKKLVYIVLSESSVISLGGAASGIALLCVIAFPFKALLAKSIDMPFLWPSGGTLAIILGASLIVSFLSGSFASLYSAVNIGKLATGAILKAE
jgi:putative ABC transport system permease protein